MSPGTEDPLERLAHSAERIAVALEQLVRAQRAPGPDLSVERPPDDSSDLAAANLHSPDALFLHLANVGDASTTIRSPILRVGEDRIEGAVVLKDGQELDTKTLTPGERCVLTFAVDPSPQLPDRAEVHVPHDPSVLRTTAVFISELKYAGLLGGRPGWEPISSRLDVVRDAAS